MKLKSKSGKWVLYGNADAEILVCGHSHAASILEASTLPELQTRSVPAISVCYSADWVAGKGGWLGEGADGAKEKNYGDRAPGLQSA